MSHQFGGLWTRTKLEILSKYLVFYSTALKNQRFSLHYADAFAGTGSHIPSSIDEEQPQLIDNEALEGSVRAALSINPSFDNYHFNDLNPEHIEQLHDLTREFSECNIHITQKDGNIFIKEFCQSLGSKDRAVLFVDPYSTQFDWDTLEFVASSNKVDLWLLFPISVIARMTPRSGDNIKPEWGDTLTRLLGTGEWEEMLYKPKELPPIDDLFGDPDVGADTERLNYGELRKWVTNRLREIFPYVSEPVSLSSNGRPLFDFYFMVSNQNVKAQALAKKVVSQILKSER